MKGLNLSRNKIRLLLLGCLSALLFFVGITVCADQSIKAQSQPYLFDEVQKIPHRKVGVVLGTSKQAKHGWPNLFYEYRMDAAAALFKAGKIDFILVSGDNRVAGYDEPTDMKNDLMARGIPENKIFLDYAGFRTFDSVVRADKVFGQKDCTFISQRFHNERAVFLAHHKDMDAIAFNAKEVSTKYGIMTYLREFLARDKAFLDIYLLQTKPHFLGEKVEIK
jgi:SanA protein